MVRKENKYNLHMGGSRGSGPPSLFLVHVVAFLTLGRRGSRIQKGGFRTFRRGGFLQEFQERIQIVAGPWANQQAKKIADSRMGGGGGSDDPKKNPGSAHVGPKIGPPPGPRLFWLVGLDLK